MKKCYAISGGAAAIIIIIIVIVLAVTLTPRTTQFQNSFTSKCEKFKGGYDCQKVWGAFEQAYVGRDKCDVPEEAYDPLIAAVPFDHVSSKTLLWSKTEDVRNDFNKNKGLAILGDTLFGIVTKGYETWCGKKGSRDTFTYYCPGASGCKNNSVRSYWSRVSAAFAEYAQGEVTALLSGSSETPFDPKSVFRNFEVPALQPGRVTRLNVVLVTKKNFKSNCASLGELRRQLDARIECWCKEVPESQMSDDSSIPEKPCGS